MDRSAVGAMCEPRSVLIAIVVLAAFFFVSRGTAEAALHVCNGTNAPVTVAIATLESGTSGIQSESEGWFQIDSQQCALVIDTDLNPDARYFLYAKSVTTLWEGKGDGSTRDAQFCTNVAGRFFYVNRGARQCTGAGEQMEWFINEPVNRLDWTVNLYDS